MEALGAEGRQGRQDSRMELQGLSAGSTAAALAAEIPDVTHRQSFTLQPAPFLRRLARRVLSL